MPDWMQNRNYLVDWPERRDKAFKPGLSQLKREEWYGYLSISLLERRSVSLVFQFLHRWQDFSSFLTQSLYHCDEADWEQLIHAAPMILASKRSNSSDLHLHFMKWSAHYTSFCKGKSRKMWFLPPCVQVYTDDLKDLSNSWRWKKRVSGLNANI